MQRATTAPRRLRSMRSHRAAGSISPISTTTCSSSSELT